MNCGTNECNIESKIRRKIKNIRSPEEIRYGQLWAEIEMPKELREKEKKKQ